MTPPLTFTTATVALVAAGGAVGSVLRFGVASAMRGMPSTAGFPWATLSVNVSGSLVIGALAGLATAGMDVSPQIRAFVMVGVLGGYTTFSTFALDGLELLHDGSPAKAIAYAVVSVVASIGAAAIGFSLTRG